MLKKIKLSQLEPNPYRHFETYPISKNKVDTLKESIDSTGFWGETIIARQFKEDGKTITQIAFGHHRLEAAREVLGPRVEVEISIRKLDDTEMLKMMARENNEVYAVTADMDIEVVRSAIEGFAEGYIDLPAPPTRTGSRGSDRSLTVDDFGFDLQRDDPSSCKFSKSSLKDLLGIPERRINAALANLKVVTKSKLATKADYRGLSHEAASALTKEVKLVEEKAGPKAARKAARKIGTEMRSRKSAKLAQGQHPARVAAKKIADGVLEDAGVVKPTPNINKFSEDVGKKISSLITDKEFIKKLDELVKHRDAMSSVHHRSMIAKLEKLEAFAVRYRLKFEGKKTGTSKRQKLLSVVR